MALFDVCDFLHYSCLTAPRLSPKRALTSGNLVRKSEGQIETRSVLQSSWQSLRGIRNSVFRKSVQIQIRSDTSEFVIHYANRPCMVSIFVFARMLFAAAIFLHFSAVCSCKPITMFMKLDSKEPAFLLTPHWFTMAPYPSLSNGSLLWVSSSCRCNELVVQL